MNNFFDHLNISHQNGDVTDMQSYILLHEKDANDAVNNCFLMLRNFKEINEHIDNIYLLLNSFSSQNDFTHSIIDRLFDYYTSNFPNLLISQSWHFIEVALEIFSKNTKVFDNKTPVTNMFVMRSIQLLQIDQGAIGSDLDVAIDRFLMIIFNTKYLESYQNRLLEFAANNPENAYSPDIIALGERW